MPNTFVKTSTGWIPLQTGPVGPPGLTLYEQPAPPATPKIGDVWIDTDDAPPIGSAATLILGALPSTPVNGQECYFLADDANGVVWRLRYRSTSASAYKWEFVGGSSLSRERMPADTANFIGGGWGAFNANDPIITVPLAGEYRCEHSATFYPTGAGAGNYGLGLKVGSASPDAFSELAAAYIAANQTGNIEQKRTVTATLGQAIAQIYGGGGYSASGELRSRTLRVTPVRVG